jgi:hypothetical protein
MIATKTKPTILYTELESTNIINTVSFLGVKPKMDSGAANRLFKQAMLLGEASEILNLIKNKKKKKSCIKYLDTIDFSTNKSLSIEAIGKIIDELLKNDYAKTIRNITINNSPDIFKHFGKKILTNFINTEKVNIRSNKINDMDMWAIIYKLPSITELDISFNSLSDSGACAICKLMPNLTKLNIGYNDLGHQAATVLSEKLTKLTELHIGFNNISDTGALAIAENLQNLAILNISLNNINEIGAIALATYLSKLKSLHIGFNNIGAKAQALLANAMPKEGLLQI